MIDYREKQIEYITKLLNIIPKSETQLQSKCAECLNKFYPDHSNRFVCVYNNSLHANTLNIGIVASASDTYWLRDGGRTCYIEFKFGKGTQTPGQKKWQQLCESLGHEYVICNDFKAFWPLIGFPEPVLENFHHLTK